MLRAGNRRPLGSDRCRGRGVLPPTSHPATSWRVCSWASSLAAILSDWLRAASSSRASPFSPYGERIAELALKELAQLGQSLRRSEVAHPSPTAARQQVAKPSYPPP